MAEETELAAVVTPNLTGRGGHRPGAGRPRRVDKHAGQIARAEKKISDKLPKIVDMMLELAMGIWVEEDTEDGKRKVYRLPPNRMACEYLINRMMGRPTDRIEADITSGGKSLSDTIAEAAKATAAIVLPPLRSDEDDKPALGHKVIDVDPEDVREEEINGED